MSDFEKVIGKEVKLGLLESIPGLGAQVRGHLMGVKSQVVEMKVSGKEISIPFKKIIKAQTVWEFRI